MNQIILSLYLGVLSLSLSSLSQQLDSVQAVIPPTEVVQQITAPINPTVEWVKTRIKHYAKIYEVSEDVLNKIVDCESGYDPKAKGDFSTTTQSYTSFGLAQIHLPAHPKITQAEAEHVEFSLDFLASNLKAGKGKMWSCYKSLTEKIDRNE